MYVGMRLPNSKDYWLDNRPHFEVLDDKYKNNNPNWEEEIWIPIRPIEWAGRQHAAWQKQGGRITVELIIFNQQRQVSEATEYKFPALAKL